MENFNQFFQVIELYYPWNTEACRSQLNTQPQLKPEFEWFRYLLHSLKIKEQQRFQQDLNLLENELEEQGLFLGADSIDQYLQKTLPPTDKKRLEIRLQSDPDFANQMTFHHVLREQVEQGKTEQFKTQLHQLETELETEGLFELPVSTQKKKELSPAPRYLRRPFILQIAACCLALFFSIYFIYNKNAGPKNHVQVFELNFTATTSNEKSLLALAEKKAENPDILPYRKSIHISFAKALRKHMEGSHQAAVGAFMTYLQSNRTDSIARFYLAINLLATNNSVNDQSTQDAINLLSDLLQKTTAPITQSEVQWYLALAYLKQENKVVAARQLLTDIQQSADPEWASKAKQLLSQLDRLDTNQ